MVHPGYTFETLNQSFLNDVIALLVLIIVSYMAAFLFNKKKKTTKNKMKTISSIGPAIVAFVLAFLICVAHSATEGKALICSSIAYIVVFLFFYLKKRKV